MRAPLIEVFSSIQGEGSFVGHPQVFLRLAGCPLRCAWCDTPGSWRIAPGAKVRIVAPGGVRREEGWATPEQAAEWIDELDPSERLALSVTGGEPLMWPEFLLILRAAIGAPRLHLETGGGHPRSLARVLAASDHVSLDLKLPADMGPPEPLVLTEGRTARPFEPSPADEAGWRAARRAALAQLAGCDACAKLVVAGGRAPELFDPLLEDAAELAPKVPLVLQPATPMAGVAAPEGTTLLRLLERALALGLDARLLPQVHRALGLP